MEKKKSSKELLKESIIELVGKNPVDKVTVNQICDNCGISRRSFYNYFQDKYELICWVYLSIVEENISSLGKNLTLHNQIVSLVESICSISEFYQNAMRYTGQNSFRSSVIQPLKNAMYQLISEVYGDELTDEIKEAVEFFIYGCIGFMEHNLLTDNIVPVDVTVLLFERCMPEILKKYI